MKKSLIFCIVCLFLSDLSAQVIWSADPNESTDLRKFFKRHDSGNYPQDFCYSSGDQVGVTPSTVITVNDPAYGKVWKVRKPKKRKRSEFASAQGTKNFYVPEEGDDIYLGWRWKIDTEDGTRINQECTVWQWKSAGASFQNYPLNMEYDGDLTLNAWGADYSNNSSQSSRRTVLWRKAVPQNKWVTLVVRIKVDSDNFGGLVQFWFNGEQQKLSNSNFNKYKVNLSNDKYTAFHRTNDGREVNPKWGVYNKKSCSYDASAYFNEMKIGKSLNSVIPSESGTNEVPNVAMTSPSNGDVFTLGETVTLGASASDNDGSVVKVNFKVDEFYYSQDANGPAYMGTFTPTETGTYVLSARAFDNDNAQTEDPVTITVVKPKGPYSGTPIFIPGLLQVEDYDEGGQGVSYNDLNVENKGADESKFRVREGVDIGSGNGSKIVGWTSNGEWMEYTVEVEESGVYDLVFTYSSLNGGGELGVDVDGAEFASGIAIPSTGDWDIYNNRTETLNLLSGEQVMRFNIEKNGFNLDKIQFVKSSVTSTLNNKANHISQVFPNPSVDGFFNLKKTAEWEILDLNGKLIIRGSGDTIDLSNESKGMYFMKVGNSISKLVKLMR